MLALVIVIVFIFFVQQYPTAFSDTLSRLFRKNEQGTNPEQEHYAALLEGLTPPTAGTPRPLDAVSLTEAFALYPFATTYRHQYIVRYTDGERTAERYVTLIRADEQYQILQFNGTRIDPSALICSAVCDGEAFTVQDKFGNRHLYLLGDDFPLSSVAMLPDTETFCAMLLEYETDPEASPLSACSAELLESDDGPVLTLRFTYRDDGQSEEYRYLLDYGILASASSIQNGQVYYSLETVSFTPADQLSEEELDFAYHES